MIFDVDQAKQIILDNKNVPKGILDARAYFKKCRQLIKGKDFNELLQQISGIESTEKLAARKKFARSIKDVNKRLLREIDKIYSATGGSKTYKVKDVIAKQFYKTIGNISDNKTLEKWLQNNWCKDLYHVDPAGILFLEYTSKPKVKVYPTYKSITAVRNYLPNGQNVEWILFEPIDITGGLKQWRVVDDNTDWTFIQSGDAFINSSVKTFTHPFGQVPAIINSDIVDIETGMRLSPFDEIFEIEEELLRDLSIKNSYKNRHGFPIFWRYKVTCPTCKGFGKTGIETCKECDGKGEVRVKDVNDEATLPVPQGNEQKLAPDIAGYVSSPIQPLEQYRIEIDKLEQLCEETIWGIDKENQTNNTATAKYIDTQFRIDKYNVYADTAQWVEWQMSEWLINFFDPTKNKKENAVSISYGRRYILETADEIINKYKDLFKEGVTTSVLDELMKEHLTAKYKSNPEALLIALKRKDVEPYIHYTVEAVKNQFGANAAQKKMIFNDWWETLTNEEIKVKTIEELTTAFNEWCIANVGLEKETTTPLAVQIGVGGTQALQSILSDVNLTEEQKKGTLNVLFNFNDEQINKIFTNK